MTEPERMFSIKSILQTFVKSNNIIKIKSGRIVKSQKDFVINSPGIVMTIAGLGGVLYIFELKLSF